MRVLLLLLALASTAMAQDAPKQSPKSLWFESLRHPVTNHGCCSEADCATTAARLDADGVWRVPVADRIVAGRWVPVVNGEWVPVPPETIIQDKEPYDGMSAYVCWVHGQVYCFVRPGSGG